MKYIGRISDFYKQRGYGYIETAQRLSGRRELYFHVDDCNDFSEGDIVIYELLKNETKITAIHVNHVSHEIETVVNEWELCTYAERQMCYLAFDKAYNDNAEFRSKIEKLVTERNIIKNEELLNWFSFISERALINEFKFIDDCKDIVKHIITLKISEDYSIIEIPLPNNFPTYQELEHSISLFLKSEKPCILYTHTYEEGYDHLRYKWDGSEDVYVPAKEYSEFTYKHSFNVKGISLAIEDSIQASGNYEKDLKNKNDIILIVLSHLKNSRYLWRTISNLYCSKEQAFLNALVGRISDNLKTLILEKLHQYFITKFPYHGKLVYNSIEQAFSSPQGMVGRIILPYEIDKDIVNNHIQEQLAELKILWFIRTIVLDEIKNRSIIKSHFFDFERDKIKKDNMLLSKDGSILYEITDCNLKGITIPITVNRIEDGAFENCTSLKKYISLVKSDI